MRVPATLFRAFDGEFEKLIASFLLEEGLISDDHALESERFLARSIAPHVKRLSELFTRRTSHADDGLKRYWEKGSNPDHLRLAYFLSFMPGNLYRVAAIVCELARLGYQWPEDLPFRAVEFGAGPASGACGVAAGELLGGSGSSLKLPRSGSFALIEQSKAMLEMGERWAERFFSWTSSKLVEPLAWDLRKFHRTLSLEDGLLPRTAPRFSLMLYSFVLNEFSQDPPSVAAALHQCWHRHLDQEGLAILVEPALQFESRRLLKIREELIQLWKKDREFQVLLPCLGEQRCGALHAPTRSGKEDWCHEDVTWWRPPYLRRLDDLVGLDRKSLPMSYLAIVRSKRPRRELLPTLSSALPETTYRLVSPSHEEGRDEEFYICGQDGKHRARFRNPSSQPLERGDILWGVQARGDANSVRIESIEGRNGET